MRVRAMTFYRIAVLSIFMWSSQAQAGVFFDSSFESTPEDEGWTWSQGACNYNQVTRTNPCPYFDISTDVAHSGLRSMKGVYHTEWNYPNPEFGEQAISHRGFSTTNIYTRYWYRTTGLTYYPLATTKHFYYKNDTGFSYPNGYSAHIFGNRELMFVMQVIAEVCPTSGTGPYGTCNFYANLASKPLSDGVWYCVEEHIDLGTPNGGNGKLEIWIDGDQTLGYYNQNFLGPDGTNPGGCAGACNNSGMYFDWIQLYKQAADGLMYYDQVAAGNTRIGCTGQPSQNDLPPTAPTGLSIK